MFSLESFSEYLLERAAAVMEQQHLALEKAATLVEHRAKELIGDDSAPWPPLAAATIADKTAAGYAVPAPLLRTGEMRDSISHKAEVFDAVVYSDSEKAVWQELGTSKIPPRSFLGTALHQKRAEVEAIIGASFIAAIAGKRII